MRSELTLKKPSGIKQRFADARKKTDARLDTARITEWTVDITAYLFILLYLYTAYEKIKNHQQFETTLSQSELIGAYARFISWAVPVIEIGISAVLIMPWEKTRKASLWAATILMALFTLYLSYMLLFIPAENRTCNCGGVVSSMSWPVHLLFNAFYLLIGIDALRTQNMTRINKH